MTYCLLVTNVFKERVPPNTCTLFLDTHQCHIWILLCLFQTVWFHQMRFLWWRSDLRWPQPCPLPSAQPLARSDWCLWSKSNLMKENSFECYATERESDRRYVAAVCFTWPSRQIRVQWIYTVSHRSEYTPHIFVNVLLYLFIRQHWRNDTLLQCKVVNVQLV